MLELAIEGTGHLAVVSANARCVLKGLAPPSPNMRNQIPVLQTKSDNSNQCFCIFIHATFQILFMIPKRRYGNSYLPRLIT